MKKKWLIPTAVVTTIGAGIYLFKKIRKSDLNDGASQRAKLISYFEGKGYKVHCYNENNDFILFHQSRNEKKHVFYVDGELSMVDFQKKLEAYYYNFTNSFHFISKDEAVSKTTLGTFQGWAATLDENILSKYGKPLAEFHTTDQIINGFSDTWNY